MPHASNDYLRLVGAALMTAGAVGLRQLRQHMPGLGLGVLGVALGAYLLTEGRDAPGVLPLPGRYVVAGAAAVAGLLLIGGATTATALTTLTYASFVAVCLGCIDLRIDVGTRLIFEASCTLRLAAALGASPATAGSWLVGAAAIGGCALAWASLIVGVGLLSQDNLPDD